MSRQYWTEELAWATADGTAIANSVTETVIFPNVLIPANYMADGRALVLKAGGKLSTTGTPTMIWRVRWGGVAGTLLAVTETMTMGSAVSNAGWRLVIDIQTRANGASGSLLVMGDTFVHISATTSLYSLIGASGFDAPAPVTVDLSADTNLSLTAQWGTASASNTLTGLMYNLSSKN